MFFFYILYVSSSLYTAITLLPTRLLLLKDTFLNSPLVASSEENHIHWDTSGGLPNKLYQCGPNSVNGGYSITVDLPMCHAPKVVTIESLGLTEICSCSLPASAAMVLPFRSWDTHLGAWGSRSPCAF